MEDFKMKVTFKHSIQTFSGEIEKMVYGSYRKGKLCLGREYVYPTLNANHHDKGAITKNLAIVYSNISPTYLQDLKTYTGENAANEPEDKVLPTSFSLFMKMMYAWLKSDIEHVNLTAVTVADIVALDADVVTIKRAIDAGFLPKVKDYATLTAEIQ